VRTAAAPMTAAPLLAHSLPRCWLTHPSPPLSHHLGRNARALVQAFVPGAARLSEYSGERSAKALADWGLSLIPSKVVSVRSRADLDALLASCTAGAGKRGGGGDSGGGVGGFFGLGGGKRAGGAAAWGACLLLVTDKPSTPALFKSLSAQHAGNVGFGEVRAGSEAAAALGPAAVPTTLFTVCNGDLSTAARYEGELKSEPLKALIRGFAGGAKCAGQIKIDATTKLEALPASTLKAIVRERGLDCRGCAEKGDFVKRLREALAAAAAEGGGAAAGSEAEL